MDAVREAELLIYLLILGLRADKLEASESEQIDWASSAARAMLQDDASQEEAANIANDFLALTRHLREFLGLRVVGTRENRSLAFSVGPESFRSQQLMPNLIEERSRLARVMSWCICDSKMGRTIQ